MNSQGKNKKMSRVLTINVTKIIHELAIVILLSFVLSNALLSQCNPNPSITVDDAGITFETFGTNSCWIHIPITIMNPGPCDISAFTMIFSVTSPEGTENFVHNVSAPTAAGGIVSDQVNFPSVLFFDNLEEACFEAADVEIEYIISTLNPASSLTETIDCPFGDGLIVVCENDNSIICDDRFCEPYPCSTNVGVTVDNSDLSITDETGNTCLINIPYALTSSGTCDVGIFNIDIIVTTPEGNETFSQAINGLTAGGNSSGTVSISSEILESDVSTNCYELSDITVSSTISSTDPPEPVTSTIPCHDGKGTIEVCANNNYIICDDSSCVPWSCENALDFAIDEDNLTISNPGVAICSLNIPYQGVNNGDCDVSGFSIDIRITTPLGTQIFTDVYAGPLGSGTVFNQSFTASHTILASASGACFDIDDISISITESSTNSAQPITSTIACPDGLGTIEVCANNFEVTCDVSNCDYIIPIDLIGLEGEKTNSKVNLFWQTASEIDNDYFLIEHSSDGSSFNTIGMVNGQLHSNQITDYKFEDSEPIEGSNYYRLAMVDINGHIDFSNTIHISFDMKERNIFISPNPASDQLSIHGLDTFDQYATIQIFSAAGNLVRQFTITNDKGLNYINIQELDNGIYFIKMSDGNNSQIEKLLKI